MTMTLRRSFGSSDGFYEAGSATSPRFPKTITRSARYPAAIIMPPKAAEKQIRTARGEVLKVKSPAEFFSENKNIAGFDNPGKSLYTTIRELVENSLDACEAAGVPPEIEITLHEIDKAALDKLIGITTHERLDPALYEKAQAEGKKRSGGSSSAKDAEEGDGAPKGKQETLYYKVNVKDNGCGMKHEQIPESLGRVLAGSKYGVRQTRGKFGLGAKMALIWSKQSTGLPVEVRSATAADKPLSLCVLDIDIRENKPKTTVHKQEANTSGVRGTDISFVVGGNWSKYRAYIVRYMRQMAVITPCARWLKVPSTLSDDTAASAGLDHLKAQAAPTGPSAPPQQLGSLPWPQEPASGRCKVEDVAPSHGQVRALQAERAPGGREPHARARVRAPLGRDTARAVDDQAPPRLGARGAAQLAARRVQGEAARQVPRQGVHVRLARARGQAARPARRLKASTLCGAAPPSAHLVAYRAQDAQTHPRSPAFTSLGACRGLRDSPSVVPKDERLPHAPHQASCAGRTPRRWPRSTRRRRCSSRT